MPNDKVHVLVCVTTANDRGPNYAGIAINKSSASELMQYRDLTVPLIAHDDSFYCIEFFDSSSIRWNDRLIDEDLEDSLDSSSEWLRVEQLDDIDQLFDKANSLRLAAETAKITRDGVLWSASPKHSDGYFETQELSWYVIEQIAKGNGPVGLASIND